MAGRLQGGGQLPIAVSVITPNRLMWGLRLAVYAALLVFAGSYAGSAGGAKAPDLGPGLRGRTDQDKRIEFDMTRGGAVFSLHTVVVTSCDNSTDYPLKWDPQAGAPIDIEQYGAKVHARESV